MFSHIHSFVLVLKIFGSSIFFISNVKDFSISTKVRLKRGEPLHGEEPISSEPTFTALVQFFMNKSLVQNTVAQNLLMIHILIQLLQTVIKLQPLSFNWRLEPNSNNY